MSEWSCANVRDRLPEHVTGRLAVDEAGPMASHLRSCPGCAAEADLLAALLTTRAEAPVGLADRIRRAVLDERPPAGARPATSPSTRRWLGVPRWALAAAAALVLALGTGLFWHDVTPGSGEGPLARVALDPVPETWMDDEAVVAGAPVLDALTEEALQALLEEMEG